MAAVERHGPGRTICPAAHANSRHNIVECRHNSGLWCDTASWPGAPESHRGACLESQHFDKLLTTSNRQYFKCKTQSLANCAPLAHHPNVARSESAVEPHTLATPLALLHHVNSRYARGYRSPNLRSLPAIPVPLHHATCSQSTSTVPAPGIGCEAARQHCSAYIEGCCPETLLAALTSVAAVPVATSGMQVVLYCAMLLADAASQSSQQLSKLYS
jgi:hypothetical protein